MKQLKKTLLTLVALLAVTTGAWADEVKYPIVYDFEAAANAGENPANKNGSAANGQKFYGWENNDARKDEARQDYKGYEYAEGSKLPEVCHVWRRSDRINGNVAGNGGLKCPSNKEMAVDGLTEGLAVTIIYDATNAKDDSKEIVWAIGDGSSESLGEPRAKAIINGAEAVPGTTTIKSGDVITVTKVTPAANGSGYIVFAVKKNMVIKKIIIDEAPTATPVALTRGTGDKINEWTLTNKMPAGNVTVSVEYFPQAAFAMSTDATPVALAPKASTSARANTDDPLVEGGTVAGIVDDEALLEEGQGTLLYHFSATQLDAAALEALTATDWTDKVPTADGLAEGTVYVYYYIKGADDLPGITPGAKFTFSDSDIQELSVTLLPEPTYNVEFAEGTNPEAPAEPIWTASPATDVKKGQTVTVTYSGDRKVIGVKAEKKASTPTLKDALKDGATVVITYTWMGGTNVTTFTYTKNGDEYTGSTTGSDAEYFANDMSKEGTTLKFTASNPDHSAANVSIDFDTDTNEYVASKGGYFTSFTISVNGTDLTSQLTEVK